MDSLIQALDRAYNPKNPISKLWFFLFMYETLPETIRLHNLPVGRFRSKCCFKKLINELNDSLNINLIINNNYKISKKKYVVLNKNIKYDDLRILLKRSIKRRDSEKFRPKKIIVNAD